MNYDKEIKDILNELIVLKGSLKTLQENTYSLIDQGNINSKAVQDIKKELKKRFPDAF